MLSKIRRFPTITVQAIFIIILFATGAGFAQSKPLTEEERIVKAINKVKTSVVNIRATGRRPGGRNFVETGSGIVVKHNGFILTNYHIVRYSSNIMVTIYNGKKYHGVVIGKSPRDDIAVLRINATGLKKPKWGNSKTLKVGQTAIAIGNPYKFDWSVSRGIISQIRRTVKVKKLGIIYKQMIQTDAAINPGSSGGALIDSRGRVIGMNTLVFSPAQGIGFAIPIHRALKVSQMLMSRKVYYNPKPWIGISGRNITPEMAEMNMMPIEMGVLITNVQPISPAHRGGLRKGDVVVLVNDNLIRKVADFKRVLANSKPGQVLKLSIWRGEKNLTLNIKVSQRSSGGK